MTEVTQAQKLAEFEAANASLALEVERLTRELKIAQRAAANLTVEVKVQTGLNKILRDGLKFYLPGDFWETVVQDTKADQDKGKHAEWILRLADDGTNSAAA